MAGGAPKGNDNAAKSKRLSSVLQKRLADRELEQGLMDKLLDLALGGDLAAIKEVFDRIDGKPKQAIIGGDEDDAPLQIQQIERIIVKATDTDS